MQMRINIPPLTRVLLALLLTISIAHQITRYVFGGLDPELLALIPQWSLFYPWVYFTATFAEQNVVTLLIAGATILYGGKYLERAWGSTEFGKFVLLVTVLPNVVSTFVYVLWFAITQDDSRAYVRDLPNPFDTPELTSSFLPQFGFHPRFRRTPRRLPRRFQAACSGAYSHNTAGHHQNTSQTFPCYLSCREYNLRTGHWNRYGACVRLGWLLYKLDIPSFLPKTDRVFWSQHRRTHNKGRCIRNFRFRLFLA